MTATSIRFGFPTAGVAADAPPGTTGGGWLGPACPLDGFEDLFFPPISTAHGRTFP